MAGLAMKQEDVIRMAREAGFNTEREMIWVDGLEISPYMQRFAALVAAAERKACAKVCEAYIAEGIGKEMAAAIRARGQE